MSFSSNVKEELSGKMPKARHCRLAETAALLSFDGRVQPANASHGLVLLTDNFWVARKMFRLLKETFSITVNLSVRERRGSGRNRSYRLEIPRAAEAAGVLRSCKVKNMGGEGQENFFLTQNMVIQNTCCKRAFLRGAFLAAGSISDPERFYHFEIACQTEEKAQQISDLMRVFDLEPRTVKRKKYRVVYLKEGDQIVDALNVMEATRSLLELENIRILKEMRGSVNRQVNCETANINKTVSASVHQTEDILTIRDTVGLDSLPKPLKEMAEIRLANPEATLLELGEACSPPLGKSGVNHRLRKLTAIARQIREESGGV